MKKFKSAPWLLLVIIFAISFTSKAQTNDWENPRIFEINQTIQHTPLVPFETSEKALSNNPEATNFYHSLNGDWKFKLVDSPNNVPQNFFSPGYNTKSWSELPVPSNWQMHGYDYPKFRNISQTFSGKPPYPPEHNPTGLYVREFTIPASWQSRQVFLHFEGVKSASYVWVNGENVGYNQGGMEPAEFDITQFLQKGKNHIAVQVMRYSDGTYLENQDMWRLSGIYRPVYLFAAPKVHMRDYYVITDLDDDYRDANLITEIDVATYQNSKINGETLRVTLLDKEQEIMSKTQEIPTRAGLVKINQTINNPKKWSAEKPYLYTLLIELLNAKNEVIEAYSQKTGFREVKVKDRVFLVNGKPIKLNGVNSHVQHPVHGKAMPVATMREDLIILKQFNVNCVRTSHYPPNKEYLQLADELGMYIVDEAGTECHNNIYLSKLPEWRNQFVDRGVKMVLRDRNHPSIIMWSAGNEAGVGSSLEDLIDTCKIIDPSRPAWMYGGNTFKIPFEDIIGPRYWFPWELQQLAEQPISEDPRPSFMDEYLSVTGNALGGLDEYWELIEKYPRLSGGAIWDFVSPGLEWPLKLIKDTSGNNNHGAIMGRDHLVKGKSGQAIYLSGHDEWIEFYQSESLDITSDQLTIAFDVKPSDWMDINNFVTKGSHQFGVSQFTPDSLTFYLTTTDKTKLTVPVPENWFNQWHQVMAVYNGSELQLYVDNKLLGSKIHSGKLTNTPFPVNVGRNMEQQQQGEWNGYLAHITMDNLLIFDQAVQPNGEIDFSQLAGDALLALDFDELEDAGNFYYMGLGARNYGLIWPDRSIQPEMYQLKKVGQPVDMKMIDGHQGLFAIENRYDFTNLNDLEQTWQLTSNGKIISSGAMNWNLAPGMKQQVNIDWGKLEQTNQEVILTLSFQLKEDKNWAKKGHEVAFAQFIIKEAGDQLKSKRKAGEIELADNANEYIISGENFEYKFSKASGALQSITINGKQLLESSLKLNMWHAPTSNETDSWNEWRIKPIELTTGQGNSISNHWRTYGIDQAKEKLEKLEVYDLEDIVTIEVATTAVFNGNAGALKNTYTYAIDGSGQIILNHKIMPVGRQPDFFPKLGLSFDVKHEFNQTNYYGRGPFENYPDRKTAAKIGKYQLPASDYYVPYLTPQENGNRSDVRWATITDNAGNGVKITGQTPFHWSVSEYELDHLTRALYPFQLQKQKAVTVNVDYEISGVGETSTLVLPAYRVAPQNMERTISILPIWGN